MNDVQIANFQEKIMRAAERGVKKAAEDLKVSSQQLAPKSGRGSSEENVPLSESAEVNSARTDMNVYARVRYTSPIALLQHKGYIKRDGRLIRFRKYTTPGTGAKFLHRPYQLKNQIYKKMIMDEVKKEIGI